MHVKPISKFLSTLCVAGTLIISTGYIYKPDKVIQINISSMLNARPVTTLTKGQLVTWIKGVDRQNGYLTMAAALFKGDKDPKALPDDPLIPANDRHPAILLHYANNEGLKYQAKLLDTGAVVIKVPKNRYSDLYLSMTSAYGDSKLQLELVYKDGVEATNFSFPDWYKDVKDNDPDLSYVVHNLGKWGNQNQLIEADHHDIHALNIHPDNKRLLTAVRLRNLSKTYLLLWAATGVINK